MDTLNWEKCNYTSLDEYLHKLIDKGYEIVCVVPTAYSPFTFELQSALIVFKQ